MTTKTKRRNQTGSKLQSKSLLNQQLIEQIEQIPQHWSIACIIGFERELFIAVCQDDPIVLQAKFVRATGQSATILKRLEKNSFLTIAHLDRPDRLTLLHPDSIHSYIKSVMQVGKLERLRCILTVSKYADATALKYLLRMWHTS
jgi:hypothetical protein